jgi:hypothetical protein
VVKLGNIEPPQSVNMQNYRQNRPQTTALIAIVGSRAYNLTMKWLNHARIARFFVQTVARLETAWITCQAVHLAL